jgi:hypothetical protein
MHRPWNANGIDFSSASAKNFLEAIWLVYLKFKKKNQKQINSSSHLSNFHLSNVIILNLVGAMNSSKYQSELIIIWWRWIYFFYSWLLVGGGIQMDSRIVSPIHKLTWMSLSPSGVHFSVGGLSLCFLLFFKKNSHTTWWLFLFCEGLFYFMASATGQQASNGIYTHTHTHTQSYNNVLLDSKSFLI